MPGNQPKMYSGCEKFLGLLSCPVCGKIKYLHFIMPAANVRRMAASHRITAAFKQSFICAKCHHSMGLKQVYDRRGMLLFDSRQVFVKNSHQSALPA